MKLPSMPSLSRRNLARLAGAAWLTAFSLMNLMSEDAPASTGLDTYSLSGSITVKRPGTLHVRLLTPQEFQRESDDDRSGDNTGATIPDALTIMVGPDEARASKVPWKLDGIPAGDWCISCYLDSNGNGRLDSGILGPTEPWGYAGLASKPFLRGPKLSEVVLPVQSNRTGLDIILF